MYLWKNSIRLSKKNQHHYYSSNTGGGASQIKVCYDTSIILRLKPGKYKQQKGKLEGDLSDEHKCKASH